MLQACNRSRAARMPHFNVTAPAERNAGLVCTRPSINWLDEFESIQPPRQDPELRRLVDLLPEDERHIIERMYFGGVSSHQAARELGLEPTAGERLRRRGLRQLRSWLADGAPRRDPDRKRGKVEKEPEPEPERAWQALDPAALETTLRGRYRGDGRRLDSYVLNDPVAYEGDR